MRSRGIAAVHSTRLGQLHYTVVLSNSEVARKLLEIRTLMELAGESFYKYTAFEKAAASVENAAPLADLVAAGEHLKLSGVGKSIGAVIGQLVTTGTADQLEELYRRFPPTLLEVLGVSGIGTKTAGMLFSEYGIASLADLEAAIAADTLAGVPRLGSKTIENWKRGILAYRGRQRRTPLPLALEIAHEAMAYVRMGPPLERLTFAGSLRRCEVTVGDIDLVCTSPSAADVVAHFAGWDRAEAVLAEGPTKASIWLAGGLQIDLRVLPDHVYGNLLQHFTGSREHNIKLREYAVRRNLRVSENGILNLESGEVVTCVDEAGVYARARHAVHPARASQRARRNRARAQERDSVAGRGERSAWRFPHAHDLQRRRRYFGGDDRRRGRARLRVSRDQRSFGRRPRAASVSIKPPRSRSVRRSRC